MVTLSEVTKLYVATFNRAPDAAGINYWVNSGLTIEQIAQSFFDQSETQTLYPSGTANSSFVTSVYANLFNRAPDQGGLDYWVGELNNGNISKQNFILAVINGAQNTAISQDATILTNKQTVGLDFVAKGLEDVTLARSVMSRINATIDSVNDALGLLIEAISTDTLYLLAEMQSIINDRLGVFELLTSTNNIVQALNSSYSWKNDVITYSFNTTIPSDYSSIEDMYGWQQVPNNVQSIVNTIMASTSQLIGISLTQVNVDGDIRFNMIVPSGNENGHAYYPSDYSLIGGDIFLSNALGNGATNNLITYGGYGIFTIMHELGHALRYLA